jgi:co-chaperonin GroES (HSP10)
MLKPVNNHLLIEPLKHDSFISTDGGTYEEIGTVIEVCDNLENDIGANYTQGVKKGDKVFFDSWLAAKYPTGKGEDYYWLVKWEDVRAIEHEDKVPE